MKMVEWKADPLYVLKAELESITADMFLSWISTVYEDTLGDSVTEVGGTGTVAGRRQDWISKNV